MTWTTLPDAGYTEREFGIKFGDANILPSVSGNVKCIGCTKNKTLVLVVAGVSL